MLRRGDVRGATAPGRGGEFRGYEYGWGEKGGGRVRSRGPRSLLVGKLGAREPRGNHRLYSKPMRVYACFQVDRRRRVPRRSKTKKRLRPGPHPAAHCPASGSRARVTGSGPRLTAHGARPSPAALRAGRRASGPRRRGGRRLGRRCGATSASSCRQPPASAAVPVTSITSLPTRPFHFSSITPLPSRPFLHVPSATSLPPRPFRHVPSTPLPLRPFGRIPASPVTPPVKRRRPLSAAGGVPHRHGAPQQGRDGTATGACAGAPGLAQTGLYQPRLG